ncbi:protein AMN1-like protein [Senna tora]|uniref:Protein AMN1-like protein n=1 Tax=Senna tora TaxID=362788 RepID=A0A834WRB9_9FABA|nr:protein AMN1-like protein [Senna tora]
MDKGKSVKPLTSSLQNLDLNPGSNIKPKPSNIIIANPQFPSTFCFFFSFIIDLLFLWLLPKKTKPPSLVSLCLGVVGKNLDDIIDDLGEIAVNLPADIKMALAAIARRRKLLNDAVLISLADTSWEIIDVSGSDVSDFGIIKAAEICRFIRALDISRCSKITATGISELVKHCHLLETLRCGGCPRSDGTARRCLSIFKPNLNYVEEDSWEELDTNEIASGAQSLRWLVWPNIDKVTLEDVAAECPRIVVNPKQSPFGFNGNHVPWEALQHMVLDDAVVKDIDPRTWAIHGFTMKPSSPPLSSPTEMSVAEKFRLAFEERDTRLAPKRAKNARQHQRRAVRELMLMSTRAKAAVLASQASKSLNSRS